MHLHLNLHLHSTHLLKITRGVFMSMCQAHQGPPLQICVMHVFVEDVGMERNLSLCVLIDEDTFSEGRVGHPSSPFGPGPP